MSNPKKPGWEVNKEVVEREEARFDCCSHPSAAERGDVQGGIVVND